MKLSKKTFHPEQPNFIELKASGV